MQFAHLRTTFLTALIFAVLSLTCATHSQAGVITCLGEGKACLAITVSSSGEAPVPAFNSTLASGDGFAALPGPELVKLVAAAGSFAEMDTDATSRALVYALTLIFPSPPISELLRPS